jgi:glycopeptide antibiotics resistance protein
VKTGDLIAQLGGLALFVIPVAIALLLSAHFARRDPVDGGKDRIAIFTVFCVYIAVVGAATLAPPPMSMGNGRFGTNLIPLIYSFRCFTPNPGQPSTTRFCLETIIGNVALFVPLGVLLPLISRRKTSAGKFFLIAAAGSISIELLQYAGRWVGNDRWSDVDDVIFNVAGAMCGFWLLAVLLKAKTSGRAKSSG